jgi:hypothetical protein
MEGVIMFTTLGIVLLLIGCWRAYIWVRHRRDELPRWLSIVRASSEAASWLCGALLMMLLSSDAQPVGGLVIWLRFWLLLLCMAAIGATAVTSKILGAFHAAGLPSFGQFTADRIALTKRWLLATIRRAVRAVAPQGPKEIQLGFFALDRLMAAGTVARSYLLILIFMPVLLAVAFTWALNRGTDFERRVMGVMVGYNTLAIASWMTVAMILVLAAATVAVYVKTLRIDLNLRRVFGTVAVWSGYGTAAGFIAAALLPVFIRIMPGTYATADGTEAVLPPQLLIDVPAAGAIAGYVFGIVIASSVLCENARHLLLRRIFAPALLFTVLFVLTRIDLGPRSILHGILTPIPLPEADACTDAGFTNHIDESGWVMQALRACGSDGAVVDDQTMLWTMGLLIAAVAITKFIIDFRHRYQSTTDPMPTEPSGRFTALAQSPSRTPDVTS